MFRSPYFYAIISYLTLTFLLGIMLPDLTCNDGWKSSSIGSSGACAHHEGVNYTPLVIANFFSIAISLLVLKKFKSLNIQLKNENNQYISVANKVSIRLLCLINNFCCRLWDNFVTILSKLGAGKLFEKYTLSSILLAFILTVFFPYAAIIIYLLGIVAFLNGANSITNFKVNKP